MVDVTIEGDRAIFNVEGSHKLWAFKSRVDIPLSHITGVEINHELVGTWWHGIKLIGTDVMGLFAAGTFYYHGELVFWDMRDVTKTIIVSLDHERYKKLIVEVNDPVETARALNAACGR